MVLAALAVPRGGTQLPPKSVLHFSHINSTAGGSLLGAFKCWTKLPLRHLLCSIALIYLQACISRRTKSFLGAHPGAPHLSPLLHGKNKGSKSFHIPSSSSVARPYRAPINLFLLDSQPLLVAIASVSQRNQITEVAAWLGLDPRPT